MSCLNRSPVPAAASPTVSRCGEFQSDKHGLVGEVCHPWTSVVETALRVSCPILIWASPDRISWGGSMRLLLFAALLLAVPVPNEVLAQNDDLRCVDWGR